MFPTLRLTQQGLLLVAVPLVFELAFVGVLTGLIYKVQSEAKAADESKVIVSQINNVEKCLYCNLSDVATSISGPWWPGEVDRSAESKRKCIEEFQILLTMLAGRYDSETIDGLKNEIESLFNVIDRNRASLKKNGLASLIFKGEIHLSALGDCLDILAQDLDQISEHEKGLSQSVSGSDQRARESLLVAVYFGVGANMVIALLLSLYFSRSVIEKMNRLGENAARFSKMQPMLQPLNEDTEFAELDRVLHDMAMVVSLSTKRERAAIENAVDVICTISDRGKFLAISPAATHAWGYEPEILLGRPYVQLTGGASFDAIKETSGDQFEWEAELERSDGELKSTSWSIKLSSDGTLFCVVRDITEKKRAELLLKASEAEVRTLIENMFTAVLKTSADGTILAVNPRTVELLGFPAEELVNQHISRVFKQLGEVSQMQFFESLKKSALNRVVEYSAVSKASNDVPVDVCLSKYESTQGTAYVLNLLDSSERRQVQELKQQFTAMISHDLRSPLSSVCNMLELTIAGAYGDISETCANRIEIAQKNLIRLMNLINELLEVDKLDSGTMQIEPKTTKVAGIFDQAVWSIEDFAKRNGISLHKEPCDFTLFVDEKRIVQVLINLISNSIKFSAPKTTITLSAEQKEGFGVIRVIDQGQGIAKENLPYLFDRFTRVSKAGRGDIKSTGLGLSICKSMVELHDGHIEVESEVGVGTTFVIWLPQAGEKFLQKEVAPAEPEAAYTNI
ncbi:hypothetical protein BH10CYA1_BH10CYA1_61800 [soil metagenome]